MNMKNEESLYELLEKDYERSFSEMSKKPEGVRYLKIRSLIDVEPIKASQTLREFLRISEKRMKRLNIYEIRRTLFFDSNLSNEKINELLKKVYTDLKLFRRIDFEKIKHSVIKIAQEGDEYWSAWNSVYRDDIRQHIQYHFVRTMQIQSYDELLEKINKQLDPIIKGYVIISWYNQWCSTIIEDMILTHPRVVPTARRIDKVDFFFLDIPFDLKISFIPREFIKQQVKKRNISREDETKIINRIRDNPETLIKWFYENQGEPRFSDSHRLFIVLADSTNLENSWKLKAELSIIQNAINDFLDNYEKDDIRIVEWSFKGRKIRGNFKTYSHIILIVK